MGDNASFQVLSISDILPNRFQPRIKFEDEALDELAESISRFGVIEPIVVRPIGSKYEIIAGERRYKASKLASKTTIPSIIINLSDKDSEELALLENVQRQSLNPIEEAVSYKRILDMGYITREELSKKIGKPQSVILNKTRLLNLADEVQSYLLNNKISERHARALLSITNLDDQVEMLHRIVNERLTLKKTNKEIRRYLESHDDDNTETLFIDERGNDKMDIDKIMREAQDINAETKVDIPAPDLMASPVQPQESTSQVFENTSVNTENVISQEPNKFISVSPAASSVGTLGQSDNSSANGNSTVSFDNVFNSSVNSQDLNTSTETVTASNLQPTSPMVNSSINDEISSIVSDALKDQPISNQVLSEKEAPSTNVPVDTIPDFNINNSVNTVVDNIQPGEPVNNLSASLNQNQTLNVPNGVQTPVVEVPSVPLTETIGVVNNSISSEPENTTPIVETTPVNNDINPIIQSNSQVLETPQTNISNNVPDFTKIVQKLRECADEIEKSGHFVNLEEVDLGNQYKVIFTFDK